MTLTPLHLRILLHYFSGVGVFQPTSTTSDDYTQDLINDGLLERAPVSPGPLQSITPMMITEKGRAFLRMILKTPLPAEVWVDPRTKEIV